MNSPTLQILGTTAGRVPLVVNRDALFSTDAAIESAMAVVREKPQTLLSLPRWLVHGWAGVRAGLASQSHRDGQGSCYRADVLEYLRQQKQGGGRIELLADEYKKDVRAVAQEVGLFDAIVTTTGSSQPSAEPMDDSPVRVDIGARGYDYLGTCRGDDHWWLNARAVLAVAPSRRLETQIAANGSLAKVFRQAAGGLRDHLRALRPLHWVKNLLLLLPIGAAHHLPDLRLLSQLMLAWLAFSLCSSSIYLLNDLFDLQTDRQHRDTKERPLASGRIRASSALMETMVLLVVAVALGWQLPSGFLLAMAAYYLLNCLYSVGLKNIPVLDVLVLAGGYVLRVLAGSYVVGIHPSAWLMALCMFLFLSLALIKRYAELIAIAWVSGPDARVRGYLASDASLIAIEGIASGYIAVLVIALYTNSSVAQELYARHNLFWLICLLLLYWINYLWLMARRGKLPHDPVTFALKDRTSLLLLVAIGVVILCAL